MRFTKISHNWRSILTNLSVNYLQVSSKKFTLSGFRSVYSYRKFERVIYLYLHLELLTNCLTTFGSLSMLTLLKFPSLQLYTCLHDKIIQCFACVFHISNRNLKTNSFQSTLENCFGKSCGLVQLWISPDSTGSRGSQSSILTRVLPTFSLRGTPGTPFV